MFSTVRTSESLTVWAGRRAFRVPAAVGEAEALSALGSQRAVAVPRVVGSDALAEAVAALGITSAGPAVRVVDEADLGALAGGRAADEQLLALGPGRALLVAPGVDLGLLTARLRTTAVPGESAGVSFAELPGESRLEAIGLIRALTTAPPASVCAYRDGRFEPVGLLPLPDAAYEPTRPDDGAPVSPVDCAPARSVDCAPARLLDGDLGVFTGIAALPPLPEPLGGWTHLQVRAAALGRIRPDWSPDGLVPVAAPPGEEPERTALLTAAGFYASEDFGQLDLVRGSAASLRAAGESVVPLGEFPLFADGLSGLPGFPFAVPADTTELVWARAVCATTGAEVRVPLSVVVTDPRISQPTPVTNPPNLYGMGAGADGQEALEKGLAMLIASDAAYRWWCGEGRLTLLSDESPSGEGDAVCVRTFALADAGRVDAPTVLVVIESGPRRHEGAGEGSSAGPPDDAGVLVVGAGAGADQKTAAERATASAIIQWRSACDLASASSTLAGAGGTAEVRADRRYLDAFGPDLRGVGEPMAHLQCGLDPRVRAHLIDRLGEALAPTAATGDADREEPSGDGVPLLDAAKAAGIDVLAVDLTTADLAAAGVCAVRALAPGLLPTTPAAFPPAGPALPCIESDGESQALPYPGW